MKIVMRNPPKGFEAEAEITDYRTPVKGDWLLRGVEWVERCSSNSQYISQYPILTLKGDGAADALLEAFNLEVGGLYAGIPSVRGTIVLEIKDKHTVIRHFSGTRPSDEIPLDTCAIARGGFRDCYTKIARSDDRAVAAMGPAEPDWSYVDCEIFEDDNDLCFTLEGYSRSISRAVNDKRFVGFMYDSPVYQALKGVPCINPRLPSSFVKGNEAMIYPTHVRFAK